jgi:MFS family permease
MRNISSSRDRVPGLVYVFDQPDREIAMAVAFLDRSRTIAPANWSRWLIPPAALAVSLSIGQAYAWSVFKPPLEKALDLSGTQSALPFQLAIVMLGLSAAFGGTLVERRGPRWAMFISATFFSAGFLISALGAVTSQYWLIVLGYGFVGGIGLGIGYIAPVSTLIKWFPDRPGMATGIAIMGFGGGALIASPWSSSMLSSFGSTPGGIGAAFLILGVVYAVFMSLGVLLIRVPAEGWRPAGWQPSAVNNNTMITTANVSAANAIKTPQFWFLWIVLCFNVTAGIGILEKAAPMIGDFFKQTSAPVSTTAAAGFVALLSLTNMLGRFVWSSTSDVVGRRNIYRGYLGIGALLYLVIALTGNSSKLVFILAAMLILSFYGAGFATVPAYLKDLFGTFQVGAIHGRLLTAWSVAGVLGPLIVDKIADNAKAAGKQGPDLYTTSFYIMIALLVVAFIANELIRPVNARFHEPVAPVRSPEPVGREAE